MLQQECKSKTACASIKHHGEMSSSRKEVCTSRVSSKKRAYTGQGGDKEEGLPGGEKMNVERSFGKEL